MKTVLSVSDIDQALAHLDPSCPREEWIAIGMALHNFDPGDTGLDLWECWSRGSDKYKPGHCERNWRTFAAKDGGVGVGTLIKLAQEAGWELPEATKGPKGKPKAAGSRRKPVAAPKPASKTFWTSIDQARTEYAKLPLASKHDAARLFLASEYGLEPHQVPEEWRILNLTWKAREDEKPYGPGVVYFGRTPDGEPVLKYRSLRRIKGKRLTQFLFKSGNGYAAIVMPYDVAAPLVITGGEEKGAAAWAAGFNVLCLLVGEKAPDTEWCRWVVGQNYPSVVLAFDADDDGKHATEKSLEAIGAAGYPKLRIHAVKWPATAAKGYDLNDAALDGIDLLDLIENAPPCHQRMSFLTPGQFFGLKFCDDDSLLDERLLSVGETALLLGPGGIGKSRLAYQLALAHINGWDWCGLKTYGGPKKWMFIQVENNARRTVHDLGCMLKGSSREVIDRINGHLVLLANTQRSDREVNLAFDDNRERLSQEIALHSPDIVVVDPWIEFFGGTSENDNTEQRQSIHLLESAIRSMRPTCAILIVHHSAGGKSGALKSTGYDAINYTRGAKALVYAARSAINVAQGDEEGETLVVACGKNNNGRHFDRRAVRLDPIRMHYDLEPGFDFDKWEDELKGTSKGRKMALDSSVVIVRLPTNGGEITQKELTDSVMEGHDVSQQTVNRLLKRMETDGLVSIKTLQTGSFKTNYISRARQ